MVVFSLAIIVDEFFVKWKT